MNTFAHIFECNKKYTEIKKRFSADNNNEMFERNAKEAFKCTVAVDFITLLEKTGYMTGKIEFPDYIMEALSKGPYKGVEKTVWCICGYTKSRNEEYCDSKRNYTDKLRNNKNHRFNVYYSHIHKDILKELKFYKGNLNEETYKRYKAAILILHIFFRTFYFKALPKALDVDMFNKCSSQCTNKKDTFADLYKFDADKNVYIRRKFKSKSALAFNNDIAWLLVYKELKRFKLVNR